MEHTNTQDDMHFHERGFFCQIILVWWMDIGLIRSVMQF